ncbi:phenazine biosynthesis protein PhzF [Nocardioides baekrokdamisoli]|uniref:Phenazine biosynthesis protein PhzF n=1 Tax=Nocardioides baekrokdamisoli TaxID=1804624 RepID=A0A3G9IC01_9ACTN|nr:PhzF family phenazine biosynthesis protein [Nocardioides baekrokdamisoli]BBH15826.1 phenazine biosynthesis protein PhzF [Nocardioides baekrokdamisoli]
MRSSASRAFRQVDVFSAEPLLGNPVAVVHDADDLTDEQMGAFARWTNLSETTFLLRPSDPAADYRLRIFTPGGELPFAGHPTLGSAHAWLEAGGVARGEALVQECAVGLVTLRRAPRLAFQAPPLQRFGPPTPAERAQVAAALGIHDSAILDISWIVNGPRWIAAELATVDEVLALTPDASKFVDMEIAAFARYPVGGDCAIEVRAFPVPLGISEDPVTGSLNAGLGQWLAGSGLPSQYVASQGTVLQRRGRVHIAKESDGTVWVGGDTGTTLVGTATF